MKTKWSLLEKRAKITPFDIPVDYNIINILTNRGIKNKKEIIEFLNPKISNLESPQGLYNINKALDIIIQAIKNNSKICIYGDYDVDGITSTSILYLALKKLNHNNIFYYIPLRDEGYGLNKNAINEIKNSDTDLIITVDCGINSFEEVEYIKKLNMKVIITDHHDIAGRLPMAHACINPKIEDNNYSFPSLAGVGTIFMVILELYKKLLTPEEAYEFLDLVALGTVADIMPLIKENRILVKYGLEKMKETKNLGLKCILEKLELYGKDLTPGNISFKIAPIFNAAGRLSDAKIVVKLLISDNINEINTLVDNLIFNNSNRKKIQDSIIEEVLNKIEENKDYEEDILIAHSPEYHHGLIGIVAAKVVETYYKPSIIMEENLDEGIAVGSCRSIEGFNITRALSYVSKYLIKFGGHANAAGFTLKLEHLDDFKREIKNYAKKQLKGISLIKNINIDMRIPAQKISYEFIQSLNLLKPFGFGNPTPILMTKNCIIHNPSRIGNNGDHLKFDIDQKGFSVKGAVWFNNGNKFNELKNENIFYDLVFKLETSMFNDRIYPNIIIEDMKISDLEDDRFHFYHSMYYTSFPMKSLFYTNLDIDKNDKIYLKRNFDSYSVFRGQKSISKLDKNISNLLYCLENFYEYNFEIKIENIHTFQNHKIVDILIKRKYELENFTNKDAVQFRNIKKFLLGDIEYNEFTKEALSVFYRENKSIIISKVNIKGYIEEKEIAIKEEFYYPLLLTIGMKYFFENNKKMTFYTTNKFYVENIQLKHYFNFKNIITKEDNEDICIFDFQTIKKVKFELKYNKCIIFSSKDYTKDNFYVIKKEIHLPKNVIKFDKNLLNKINYDLLFSKYLPIKNKLNLLQDIKNGKVIYADESILNYY